MHRFHSSTICSLALSIAAIAAQTPSANACTNFVVSKGASVDGSTMVTYAADSHELYGELYFTPAAKHPKGAKRTIREWDTQELLGEIDQVPETFRVVGNINEHQLVIAETTFGGRKELRNPDGKIDYGSLMYIALERAKTAREAIEVITSLANEHGYKSSGESFSIADPNEAWIMDFIGKGPEDKGIVWVACKVPEGYVTAHANQPRIRTFPQNDPNQCVFAKDTISFAKKKGYFDGPDEKFSFVDAYANQTCQDLRAREARVWSFYHRIAPSMNLSPDYAACKPGTEPYPLWIKPDKKLSVQDLMRLMRDHFEDTVFDMRNDVGAGPYQLPYRWRPMTWEHGGKTYMHERATATQQTGFSFVSQSRAWLPGDIGGVLWFSVDDMASTVYVPMYAGITKSPKPYAVGTATFDKFSWDSAFWVFSWVSNFSYLRYVDMIKDVQKAQGELEGGFFANQAAFETKMLALHKTSSTAAAKELTKYSSDASDKVLVRWKDLGPELLVKYMDGNVRDEAGKITHPPYPPSWYAQIVAEKGDHQHLRDVPIKAPTPDSSAAAASASASAAMGAPPTASVADQAGASEPSKQTTSSACSIGGQSAAGGSPASGTGWIALLVGAAVAVLARRRR